MKKKQTPLISVSAGCYNEAGNIREWYERTRDALDETIRAWSRIRLVDAWEIIVCDNASTDNSRDILREIAAQDKRFKVILNSGNFGQIRGPYNALMACSGDCVVHTVTDLQEPPEEICCMYTHWKAGADVVVAVRRGNATGPILSLAKKLYYKLLAWSGDADAIIPGFTGFGLYDRKVIDALRKYPAVKPYLRGMIGEVGFRRATVYYDQAPRKSGKTKNNWFSLFDYAMNGFVNQSRLPLRLATMLGFCVALCNIFVALCYTTYKLIYWDMFKAGIAPALIGFLLVSAVELFFIGIVGEYVGAVLTLVQARPLVIEEERINFE